MEEKNLFADRNSTDFPLSLVTGLNKLMVSWEPAQFLKKHQFIPVEYAMNNPQSRGLLICHSMGRGKTILAAALAWYLKRAYPTYKIVILASLTLEDNFRSNVRKLLEASDVPDGEIESFLEEYFFVPLNSGVMYKKLTKVGKSQEQMQLENQLRAFQTQLDTDVDFLEDTILFVDEAHHLFNSITNGSTNAIQFYETVMKTRRLKFFPLTGTPIIKNPFETVPCFNMLVGYGFNNADHADADHNNNNVRMPLLPETMYDFNNMFVDKAGAAPKNTEIYTNRIMGLTTYYGTLYEEGTPTGFPDMEPIVVRNIRMSSYQWSAYAIARSQEKDLSSSRYLRIAAARERFGRVDTVSTYRVASRQISNFAFPEHAISELVVPGPGGLKKTRLKSEPARVDVDDLGDINLARYSPKMLNMLQEIEKALREGERRILVYSSFVQTGINMFAKILLARHWKEWLPSPPMLNDIKEVYGASRKKQTALTDVLTFCRITGETEPQDRDTTRDHFNATEDIQVILISGTGTEGLNLLRGRLVLIMEPFWYYERTSQVIHRFYRYMGHEGLPPAERRVRVVIFLSVVPGEDDLKEIGEDMLRQKDETGQPLIKQDTTDQHLWNESLRGKALNDKFVQLLIESSIDCSVHNPDLPENVRRRIKCKMCAPNHRTLFNTDIMDDFKYPNPCHEVQENAISARELAMADGTRYYYNFTREPLDVQIYMYDPRVSGYVHMPLDHPHYAILHEKIMSTEMI